jgi:hypothetical protein
MGKHRRARNRCSDLAFYFFQQIVSALYGPVAGHEHVE